MTTEGTVSQTSEGNRVEPTRSGLFYRPNVDILEMPEELLVRADVPGVRSEDLDIDFEDGSLFIRARVNERQEPGTKYLRQEYGVGDFYRTFQVSEQIDASRITAELKDGVVTLHLPKVEAVKPRKINVQVS